MDLQSSSGEDPATLVPQRICEIFPDTIVLDHHYKIKAVSPGLLHALRFSETDLYDRPVSVLAYGNHFDQSLMHHFAPTGFFKDYRTVVHSGCGCTIPVSVSGFFLSLISGSGDYKVIQVKSFEELHLSELKLQQKTEELDLFLYRASHDLRGPIATIKGLINVARMREDDSETNLFFDLIAINAEKLDQELFKLSAKLL